MFNGSVISMFTSTEDVKVIIARAAALVVAAAAVVIVAVGVAFAAQQVSPF